MIRLFPLLDPRFSFLSDNCKERRERRDQSEFHHRGHGGEKRLKPEGGMRKILITNNAKSVEIGHSRYSAYSRYSLLSAAEVGPVFDWIIRYFTARSAEIAKNGFAAPAYSLPATRYFRPQSAEGEVEVVRSGGG
jgi:hypothetical protein